MSFYFILFPKWAGCPLWQTPATQCDGAGTAAKDDDDARRCGRFFGLRLGRPKGRTIRRPYARRYADSRSSPKEGIPACGGKTKEIEIL